MRWCWAFAVLIGCTRRDEPRIAPVKEARDAGAETIDLPEVHSHADVERLDGKRAVVVGWYDVEPVNAHKKGNHMTAIVLADGTFVWRAYGAVKSELGYASRKVRVTGVVTKGPPDPFVQAVSGPHVKLENITLENGELAPPANALPTPPMVTTMPGFASHAGRWVAVNGVVEALVRGAGAVWADAQVRLSDGGLVVLHDVYFLEWEPFKGKLASAIGRAGFEAADAAFGMTVELHGVGPPCPGVEPRCGMDTKD